MSELFTFEGFKIEDISHYGIKGMQWGIRRFQNPDGSLTPEGRKRLQARNNVIRNRQYTDDVNQIVRTLSKIEKEKLGAPLHKDWIEKDYENEIVSSKAKTFVSKIGDTPISFVEIWTNGGRTGHIALATRSGEEYRGKGYASKEVKKAIEWVERYGKKSIDELEWSAREDNISSQKLAEKYGFKYEYSEDSEEGKFKYYTRKVNK